LVIDKQNDNFLLELLLDVIGRRSFVNHHSSPLLGLDCVIISEIAGPIFEI
jgi:hypothetical protein